MTTPESSIHGIATTLEEKPIAIREEFLQHLDGLRQLLVEKKVNVVCVDGRPVAGPLAPWRNTPTRVALSTRVRVHRRGRPWSRI